MKRRTLLAGGGGLLLASHLNLQVGANERKAQMTAVDLSLNAYDPGTGTAFERVVAMFNQIPMSTLVPSLGNQAHDPIYAANQLGLGICDDYVRVFANMLRSLGAKAWVRSLNGHVGMETIIDGRRVYVDPLRGYWIEKDGVILTADQIMATASSTQVDFRSFRTGSVTTAALSTEPLMALIGTDDWSGEEFPVTEAKTTLTIPGYEAHALEALSTVPAYFNSINAGQQTTDAALFRTLKRAANIREAIADPDASRVSVHNAVTLPTSPANAINFAGSNSQIAYELDNALLVNKINISFNAANAVWGNSVIIRLADRLGNVASQIGPIAANSSYSYAFYVKDLIAANPRLLDGCVVWFIVLHDSPSKVSPIHDLLITYRAQVTPFFKARYEAATA